MVKRAAPTTPTKSFKKPRGRGRGRRKDEDSDDEELTAKLRRKQILDKNDDEEEEVEEEGGHWLEDIYIPPKITRVEHPCTGERLVIEKIVCENFKSYGGLKEMGPFHKSFSAIIGPNGNGKSNIIDAMLFVFGYRASKIRCKKVSTLIHTSELLPNLRSCAVTVHFLKIVDDGKSSNDEDYTVVPDSHIKVMRRAYADNNSVYYLENKKVKFQDVARFLKKSGIDIVHNRFLILQGEVEQIALLPPISPNGNDPGLLEFLEEVIGTKRYLKPLARLDERVEVLDYDRDDKLQRVDIAEKEKNALLEPVKKAKEFLRDSNAKIRYQHKLAQLKAFRAKKVVEEKETILGEVKTELKSLQDRLDKISEVNQARKKELQAAEKLFKDAAREYNKAKKALDAADAQYIQLSEELKRTNETRKKMQKESAKLVLDIEKLLGLPESHQKDIESLKKRKVSLDAEIEQEEIAVKGDLEALNLKVESALKDKEGADKEFARLKTIRDEKKSTFDKLQKELTNYKERGSVEEKKLADLETELEALKENVKRKEKDGRTSLGSNQLATLEKNFQAVQQEIRQLMEVEANAKNIYEQARGEYGQMAESMEGNNQLDRVDRALLEAKQDGMFPGLCGRMKNLATIPEKYNVAASISTGMLEYWVTDDENTATNCIEFLRQHDLPVQTFVCLSKLQSYSQQCRQSFATPNNSKRIYDLLTLSQPALAPAYFKAYRNTLVAENIDIATQVAYGGSRRHRVVTLLGEIIEATGSMQGGGRGRIDGKFNSKKGGITITKQQLNNLKRRVDEVTQAYQVAQDERQAAEGKARGLNEKIQEFKGKINNYTSDLAALKAQLPLKQANLEAQRLRTQDTAVIPKVLKDKETALKKAESEYQSSLDPCQKAEEKATKITEKVQELQVTKKKAITKKLDTLKETLKKVTDETNKKTVELKNCESNRKKSETKLNNVNKEIEKAQHNMEKMNEERLGLEEKGKAIKIREKELAEKTAEAKQAFEEKNTCSHEFQGEENKLNKEKVTLENRYGNLSTEVNGAKHILKSVSSTINSLAVREIPEETVEPLTALTDEEIEQLNYKELEKKVEKYVQKLNRDEPNLDILDRYKEKVENLYEKIRELETATLKRDKFRSAYCSLDSQRATEFMEGFALISSRLKEMFRMISMGGDAELEIVDVLDLFGCGVQFTVRPARKTWKKISNLSGGEKTLASLSLVFALHHFKPSPFYVMDEIDAALDFKNVSIIANYIKDRTKFTQFIIISLRSNMFELADSLLGVYKVDNMSYSIHVGVRKMVAELKKQYEHPSRKGVLSTQDTNARSTQPVGSTQQSRFPDVNLSDIIDDSDDTGNTVQEADNTAPLPPIEVRVKEEENDEEQNPSSSKARLSNEPIGLEQDNVTIQNEVTCGTGSEDLFTDMETDAQGADNNGTLHSPGPMAASTPFVPRNFVRRASNAMQVNEETSSDSSSDDADSNNSEEQRMIISQESDA